MRLATFSLIWISVLTAPLASHAANPERQLQCLAATRWCVFEDFDPITQTTTKRAVVSSEGSLSGTITSRPAILLECQHGKPEWWFTAPPSFSYGPFGVRYRLDPAGVVRQTVAIPQASGKGFKIKGEFPALAMRFAARMAFQAKLASGASREIRFDVSGTEHTLTSIGCTPRESD